MVKLRKSMEQTIHGNGSLFTAVSGSAKQLFQLLRCIGFAPKAQVSISKEGLRFTVEESRVMQGLSISSCVISFNAKLR